MAKKTVTRCNCLICKSGQCSTCNSSSDYPILSHKLLSTENDVMSLDIINWRGLNGSWSNSGEAMRTISSWLINQAHATTYEIDLSKAPQRSDFPGWKHVGNHESTGKLFWNWFYWRYDGELIFSDAPDLYGTLKFRHDPNKPTIQYWHSNEYGHAHFYGDVEYVSAQAFSCTLKEMEFGDIWISVFDSHQVIIEPMVSFAEIWGYEFIDGRGKYWEDVSKGIIMPGWDHRSPNRRRGIPIEIPQQQAASILKPTQLRLL